MPSLAKITLIGNVGREPEMRMTPNGRQVSDFTVAVNRKGKNGEDVTDWFRVSAWSKTAEIVQQYVKKGNPIYVEGRLSVSQYTDKNNAPRFNLDVNADQVVLLGSREAAAVGAATAAEFDPDEVPF